MRHSRPLARVAFLIISDLCLTACPSKYLREQEFKYQHDAAAVHVAVQSVAPFDDYLDSLQPHFTLTEADALQKAIPQTRIREIEELRSLAANLKVALSTVKLGDDGSRSRVPGDVSSMEGAPSAPSISAAPLALPGYDALQMDPTLSYQAAASLVQEVALLSSYVRDAAISYDEVPYVVRLLVTAFPRARVSPYDLYSRISFYADPADTLPAIIGDTDAYTISDKSLNTIITVGATVHVEGGATTTVPTISLPKVGEPKLVSKCTDRPVRVIPLFATVRYETSLDSTQAASSTALSASLSGSAGLAGIGAGASSSDQDQQRALFRTLNTPFAVTRLSENTLEVRLAATFAGTSTGYVASAQQYFVTTLVMLPKAPRRHTGGSPDRVLDIVPCPSVRYVADTSIRNATTGEMLSPATDVIHQAIDQALGPEVCTVGLDADAFSGDHKAFATECAAKIKDGDRCEMLWNAAMDASGELGRTFGRFRVPGRYFKFFTPNARAGIIDDAKTATLTISDGEANVFALGLSGTLTVNDSKHKFYILQATKTTVDATGRIATLVFPSLTTVCPSSEKGKASDCQVVNAIVEWKRPLSRWRETEQPPFQWECDPRVNCIAVAYSKPPTQPPATLAVPAGRVVLTPPDTGTFAAIVTFGKSKAGDPAPAHLALTVEGADVQVSGDHVARSAGYWEISGDTTLAVTITKNAVPGGIIRLKVNPIGEDGKPGEDAKKMVTQDVVVIPAPVDPNAKSQSSNKS